MSVLTPPALSAAVPDNGLGSAPVLSNFEARMPKAFTVPGSTDGMNPLYDRTLSTADRLAGAQRYFTSYCQDRVHEISLISDNASKEAALKELVSVLKFVRELQTNSAEILKDIDVKALMGANMVGADAKIFAGRDIGLVPPLPDNIVDILSSRCELSNDGMTVAQTHRLVLIPATIDGVPTSVNSLRKFSAEYGKGRETAFPKQGWYASKEFANRPLAQSKWVLMYGAMAPDTGNKTDAEQIDAIKGYKQYETVGALKAIGTLVLGYLEHQRRDFYNVWCRTEDRASSGARVVVGNFHSDGLDVDDRVDRGRDYDFGRAVCRKFP